MHAIQRHALPAATQQLLHNVLSAYFRTKPLEELVDVNDRSKRILQLTYIARAGAECSSCISGNQESKQSKLRICSLDIRDGAVQQLLSGIIDSFAEQCSPVYLFVGRDTVLLGECKELLRYAMCNHDAEMIARFITQNTLITLSKS